MMQPVNMFEEYGHQFTVLSENYVSQVLLYEQTLFIDVIIVTLPETPERRADKCFQHVIKQVHQHIRVSAT